MRTMSGRDYLALSQVEKDDFVQRTLDRYTAWRFWDRPDLCDAVLNTVTLSSLYNEAAENAKDSLLMHSFVVYANEQCIESGQFS